MKKSIYLSSLAALCLILSFTGCSVIDSIVHKDIELKNVKINVPISLVTTKADGEIAEWTSFEGGYSLSIDDPMFKDLKEYEGKKMDFKISEVKVKITKKNPNVGGSTVKNFKAAASGITSKFEKAEMVLATEYTDDALNVFIKDILYKIKDGIDVDVNASGITDIDSDNIVDGEVYVLTIEPKVKVRAYLSTIL